MLARNVWQQMHVWTQLQADGKRNGPGAESHLLCSVTLLRDLTSVALPLCSSKCFEPQRSAPNCQWCLCPVPLPLCSREWSGPPLQALNVTSASLVSPLCSVLSLCFCVAVNALGHSDKRWYDALTEQAAKLAHTSNLYHTAPQVRQAPVHWGMGQGLESNNQHAHGPWTDRWDRG